MLCDIVFKGMPLRDCAWEEYRFMLSCMKEEGYLFLLEISDKGINLASLTASQRGTLLAG